MTKKELNTRIKNLTNDLYDARKNRITHPDGTFDKAGRWYPTDEEDHGISDTIRSPSRAWPYSYMTACRTKKHCRELVEAWINGDDVPPAVAARFEELEDRAELYAGQLSIVVKRTAKTIAAA